MSFSKTRIIFACIAVLSAGCADTGIWPNLGYSDPPPPAEEILISNAQYNKPYRVLGPVEFTLKTRPTLFSSQLRDREQAIDLLKQQTYARFGEEVDAIIDTRVEESSAQDANGNINIIHINGLAISFLQDSSRYSRPTNKRSSRTKAKSPKKIMVMKKDRSLDRSEDKPAAGEVEITPEEILK